MIDLTQDQIAKIRTQACNTTITNKMCEDLKRKLFLKGDNAINDFLGYDCPYTEKDDIMTTIEDVMDQMPPEEFMIFYCKYFRNEHTYPYNYANERFYFTFGTDDSHPYQGGWLIIEAPNCQTACNIFHTLYPNEHGCLRCADIYTEDTFKQTCMYENNSNFGNKCHATITLNIQ